MNDHIRVTPEEALDISKFLTRAEGGMRILDFRIVLNLPREQYHDRDCRSSVMDQRSDQRFEDRLTSAEG